MRRGLLLQSSKQYSTASWGLGGGLLQEPQCEEDMEAHGTPEALWTLPCSCSNPSSVIRAVLWLLLAEARTEPA